MFFRRIGTFLDICRHLNHITNNKYTVTRPFKWCLFNFPCYLTLDSLFKILSFRTEEGPKSRRLAFLTTWNRRDPDPGSSAIHTVHNDFSPTTNRHEDAITTCVLATNKEGFRDDVRMTGLRQHVVFAIIQVFFNISTKVLLTVVKRRPLYPLLDITHYCVQPL